MSWRERVDDRDDHDLGPNLSLQLKCPSENSPQHKPSLNGIAFQSSSASRPSIRLDMNMMSYSSPDSTLTSGNGKRCEREESRSEPHSTSLEGGPNDDSAARKKLRLTKEQTKLLEETFKHQNTLGQSEKVALASQLNLQTRQVEVWFQNRRARTKFKKNEVDCAYLKRVYKDLMEENLRLQKEAAELKALKYFQQETPPTTLRLCPQCERHVSASGPQDQKTPNWLLSKLRGN